MKKLLSLLCVCAILAISACTPNRPASAGTETPIRSAEPHIETVSVVSKKAASFRDIPQNAYYAEAARYCLEHGLVSGTAEGVFSPNMVLSRGMLVTILWRNEKSPAAGNAEFTDLKPGAYYEEAVSWAAEQQVVSGYGNGKFGPDDPIQRQQLALILYRYAQYQGQDVTVTGTSPFADESAISGYAKTAVSWAREKGIVAGKSGNRFDPQGKTTRAEAVTMLYRYLEQPVTEIPMPEESTPALTPTPTPVPPSLPYDGTFPSHEPFGQGIGVSPGRVVWDHDPESVEWTDDNEHWWELSHFDESVILRMVRESLTALTGEETAAKAWEKIIEYHNGGAGYQQGQKIAIKCNMNGSDGSIYGTSNYSYTNPVLLKALLTSLVEDLGAAPGDITAYDVSRTFPQYMIDLCSQGSLSGVRFADRVNAQRSGTAIQWSTSFGGQESFLPTCVTEAKYLINLANLKGHSYGITLCGKNHFGSFINDSSPYVPMGANLHQWLTSGRMDEYSPLTDFMANEQLGGKTILYLLDAIICARSEGSSMSTSNTKWEMAPFSGDYTASIFLSQDPVAIDSVGADFLSNEPTIGADLDDENYLHEAGQVQNAPSGTAYKNGAGKAAGNLGVHEHWNNSIQRLYSRNLGKNEGIELVTVKEQKGR